MSKLFNMSNIVLEESSTDMVSKVYDSSYLSSGLQIMRAMYNEATVNRTSLYKSIIEASSSDIENSCFGTFFSQYEKTINDYIGKMSILGKEFKIKLSNLIDANSDVINSDRQPSGRVPVLTVRNYMNLLNPDIPNINPKKAYKKEFAFLGRLFQDLDPSASEKEKIIITTTVYNSLVKEITDGWMIKVMKKIACADNMDYDSFANVVYNKFNGELRQVEINSAAASKAKININSYERFTNHIDECVSKFCEGMSDISKEIGSFLFRNKDHKLDIDTDEEGVANASYRLGDYSFNQVNKFMVAKISQITELCNLYTVAITIKMDSIYSYFKQLIEILKAYREYNTETPIDDCDFDDEFSFGDDDRIDTAIEPDGDIDEPFVNPDPQDGTTEEPVLDLEESMYLFDANMYMIERTIRETEARSQYVQEATDKEDGSLGAIMSTLADIFDKMRDAITQTFNAQIKYVSDHKAEIFAAEIPDTWTIQRYDTESLKTFALAAFDEKDAEELMDTQKYISKKYAKYTVPEDKANTTSARFIQKVYSGQEEKYGDAERKDGYEFCVSDYKTMCKYLDGEKDKLEKIVKTESEQATKESAFMEEYFNEDFNGEKSDDTKTYPKDKLLKKYAKINADVLVVVTEIYVKNFKKNYAFLKKLAGMASAKK